MLGMASGLPSPQASNISEQDRAGIVICDLRGRSLYAEGHVGGRSMLAHPGVQHPVTEFSVNTIQAEQSHRNSLY